MEVVRIARYREKDETDLRWNRILRRLTRELDTQIQDWREEVLNDVLSGAWEEYVKAINTGEKLELEGDYKGWVDKALDDAGVKAAITP